MSTVEEAEQLFIEADDLRWRLWFRRNESARLKRLYERADKRTTRRAAFFADCERSAIESSIENWAESEASL